jgi:hypothetical protein
VKLLPSFLRIKNRESQILKHVEFCFYLNRKLETQKLALQFPTSNCLIFILLHFKLMSKKNATKGGAKKILIFLFRLAPGQNAA